MSVDEKEITKWIHRNGTPCNAGFLATRPFPEEDKCWWCTEHQEYLIPNEEYHNCHLCGEYVFRGYTVSAKRHWLSDCRPDLVQHERGPTCTWWGVPNRTTGRDCYAYRNNDTREWGPEHIHFYKDGPM